MKHGRWQRGSFGRGSRARVVDEKGMSIDAPEARIGAGRDDVQTNGEELRYSAQHHNHANREVDDPAAKQR